MKYFEIKCNHSPKKYCCVHCDDKCFRALENATTDILIYLESGSLTEWYYKPAGAYIFLIEEYQLLPDEGKAMYKRYQFKQQLHDILDD